MPAPLTILFTHYGDEWFRGSERVLYDLITNLDRDRFTPVLWCNGAEMADAARSAGIVTHRTPFEYYFDYDSPAFSLTRYRAFVREGRDLVRRHDARVLHANGAAPTQWLIPVARRGRIPLLTHLHSPYLRRSRFVCRLHQADLVAGVSRFIVDDLAHDGMDPDRLRVIPNGVDFARLRRGGATDPRGQLGIPRDALVITSVGSLVARKAQALILEAFASAPDLREAHLILAGEGPDRPMLEAMIAERGLAARVHLPGDYRDMPALYGASDVFVLASHVEAFGLVLVEAGFFALPSVGTRVGGIPDVIAEGETGLLVPPNDAAALSDALSTLCRDPERRRAMGAAAKRRVEACFSVERMAGVFQDTWRDLAATPSTRSAWSFPVKPYARLLLPGGGRMAQARARSNSG
jgi:L-malate glycosyltransferase